MTVMMTKLLLIDGSELTSDVDDDDADDDDVDGIVVVGGSELGSRLSGAVDWSWAIESDVDDGDDDEIVVD